MKSLFWRIFVLSWIAMAVVGAGFSLLVATSYPTERMDRRMQRMVAAFGLHGEEVLRVRARAGEAAAEAYLRAVAADLQDNLWIFEGDALRYASDPDGEPVVPEPEVPRLVTQATPEGYREREPDLERFAISLRDEAGRPTAWTLVGVNPRPSPVQRVLEREAQRLVLIVVVAGLVSLLLARFLSRPLLKLRKATARIAQGDLSVRVTPELGRAGGELLALGRDFDAMAERLEAILESQKRLLRDVSHELRSPLARMGVALELARARAGTDAQPLLDRIERDSLRLGALISEILQLTRLDAGDPGSTVEALTLQEVADLVRGVAADVDFEAKSRGRGVACTVEDMLGAATLEGRPELLRRAVENVLRNAARFTAEGTSVDCRVRRDRDALEIRVRDHGPGVPGEALAEIFRPFVRVESARDRETGGAGIGLAIVERAVKLHKGTVTADNAEGGGLEVVLRLPLRLA